jgi:predicted nucleic acid-binding protein
MDARYLLDTSTIIYIRRQAPLSVREAFSELQQGEAVVPVITYGELIYGVTKSKQKRSGDGDPAGDAADIATNASARRCGGGVWRDSGRARVQGKADWRQ